MHSVSVATSKGTIASRHLQESATSVQTALLNCLAWISEGGFPSIFVPEAEEEVSFLKPLLEASTLPIKTREALADSGELLDVLPKLQDIRGVHSLRYQWGGSYSNKKLLCSLGRHSKCSHCGQKEAACTRTQDCSRIGYFRAHYGTTEITVCYRKKKNASIGQTTTMTPEYREHMYIWSVLGGSVTKFD